MSNVRLFLDAVVLCWLMVGDCVQGGADVPADVIPSSQPDYFCGDAWQSMVSDLEPHASLILEQFCIREIVRMVSDDTTSAVLDF